MHPFPHGDFAAKNTRAFSKKPQVCSPGFSRKWKLQDFRLKPGLRTCRVSTRLVWIGCLAFLLFGSAWGVGPTDQGALPVTNPSNPDGAWWQVTLAYDEQGLTVLEAAPIRPMTKAVVTPGLYGAPMRLAYDVAWLDAAGAELTRAATEVPLGVRAAMAAAADAGAGVVAMPPKGVRVVRLRGPRAEAVPARLSLQRAPARDAVAAAVGEPPSAFSAARLDLPILRVRRPDTPAQTAGPISATKVQNTGGDDNRLVLVTMGDGYTQANLDAGDFTVATQNLLNAFAGFSPWNVLFSGTNVYRVDVASNQQGADRQDSATSPMVDTYFNATFWADGVTDRLLAIDDVGTSRAYACADSFVGPGVWDDIFIIVNSTTYGGSGGTISVASVHPQSADVMRHEYGHTFAHLADEYSSAFPGYPPGDSEPNVDYDSSGPGLKWILWVDAGTPLPTPDITAYDGVVGAFEGARYLSTGIYRPCRNCLMRALGQQFCPICKEAHIVEYFRRMSPADAVTPDPSAEVPVPAGGVGVGITPLPFSGFQYAWTFNGVPLAGAAGPSVTLTAVQAAAATGTTATLELAVTYPTALVRTSPVEHTFDWTVRAAEQPSERYTSAHWMLY